MARRHLRGPGLRLRKRVEPWKSRWCSIRRLLQITPAQRCRPSERLHIGELGM